MTEQMQEHGDTTVITETISIDELKKNYFEYLDMKYGTIEINGSIFSASEIYWRMGGLECHDDFAEFCELDGWNSIDDTGKFALRTRVHIHNNFYGEGHQ